MSATDYLGMYAAGWTKGDADTIIKAVSDEFVLDDPNDGKIAKNELSEYLERVKENVRSLLDGNLSDPFLELSEVVTQEDDGEITAWAWWTYPGTGIRGSGLIKVGSEGVRSEVLTYHTKLPG